MLILKIIFAIFFIYAGIIHFIKPSFFKHFIPNGLPKLTINYIVGIIEFSLGIGLFFPQAVSYTAFGILILIVRTFTGVTKWTKILLAASQISLIRKKIS